MFSDIRKAWGIPELRKKLLFTLLILLIFRIGNAIPVPFVDTALLLTIINPEHTVLGLYNAMSGGAFAKRLSSRWACSPISTARSSSSC